MFNNCNSHTNGEVMFFNTIKDHIDIIFDVGCRDESLFTEFSGSVHYFDPVAAFVDKLAEHPSSNRIKFFNKFGLGSECKTIPYYPKHESFLDRIASCGASDEVNRVLLQIRTAKEYIAEAGVEKIDFLKIDTEGFELEVLHGFGEDLARVGIVQFEYGGTFIDSGVKLIDIIKFLESQNFHKFYYLTGSGVQPLTDYTDHYQYCNLVCLNRSNPFDPFELFRGL